MYEDLSGKGVLITGAASGIGKACARGFAAEGARLMLLDCDDGKGERLAKELPDALYRHCDVSREEDLETAIAVAIERFGGLDCAVNNAAISGAHAPLDQISAEDWSRVLAVNLSGVFYGVKHQIRAMSERGGAIVNVSSASGVIPTPNMGPYCAAKHGVLGLTKTAAVENARSGIRINAVLPGSTRTPMLEDSMAKSPEVEQMVIQNSVLGRLGEPEEIAAAVLWLCSRQSSYVNGHSLLIDGGTVSR